MTDPFEPLREHLAALADLKNVAQLLDWDQQTMMPPGARWLARRPSPPFRRSAMRCSSQMRPAA